MSLTTKCIYAVMNYLFEQSNKIKKKRRKLKQVPTDFKKQPLDEKTEI